MEASNIDGRKTIPHSDKSLEYRKFKGRFKNSNDGKRELMVQLLCGLHCDASIRTVSISGTHEDNVRNTDEFVKKTRVMEESDVRKFYGLMTFKRLDPN
jgi:hypothetical protein